MNDVASIALVVGLAAMLFAPAFIFPIRAALRHRSWLLFLTAFGGSLLAALLINRLVVAYGMWLASWVILNALAAYVVTRLAVRLHLSNVRSQHDAP